MYTFTDYMDDLEAMGLYAQTDKDTAQVNMVLATASMGSESGEAYDVIKKIVNHRHPADSAHLQQLLKELGDVMWYYTLALREIPLLFNVQDMPTDPETIHQTILKTNLAKLKERYPKGFTTDASLNRFDKAKCAPYCEEERPHFQPTACRFDILGKEAPAHAN